MTTKDYPAAVSARHDLIKQWLSAEGRLDVVDVAQRLGVAQETVRRDLRALESDGRLQRVHGGAVTVDANPFPGLTPHPVDDRNDLALARGLWAELPRSGTILCGAGRLTLALAHAMNADPPSDSGLTVVTNSLDAAITLARITKLSVYNIGGTVSAATRAQEGDWALQELQRLHVDVGVVCPAGISMARGFGQPTPAAAAVSRAEVACARTVIAVAAADQLGSSAFVQFADLDEVDRVLISGRPPTATTQAFLDRGLDVGIVDEVPTERPSTDSPVELAEDLG